MTMTRYDAALLTEKLDRNLITLSDARKHAARLGANIAGRTKQEFIRNMFEAINPATQDMQPALL